MMITDCKSKVPIETLAVCQFGRGIQLRGWVALTARPKDDLAYVYPGELKWTNPFFANRYDFLLDGKRLDDGRVYMHFYATGITPAMAARNVVKGSQYLIAYLDKDGNALDGSRTYKIHLPPDMPAKDFWSFTLYNNQTRSMLQTDQRFPGLDNLSKKNRKQERIGFTLAELFAMRAIKLLLLTFLAIG